MRIEIEDDTAEHPYEYCDLVGGFWVRTSRYAHLSRQHEHFVYDMNEVKDWDEMSAVQRMQSNLDGYSQMTASKFKKQYPIIIPMSSYEHGGLTIGPYQSKAHCPWDSNPNFGCVFITREQITEEWGKGRKAIEKAKKALLSNIEIMDHWLQGDMYSIRVTDEDGELIDGVHQVYPYEKAEKLKDEYLARWPDAEVEVPEWMR